MGTLLFLYIQLELDVHVLLMLHAILLEPLVLRLLNRSNNQINQMDKIPLCQLVVYSFLLPLLLPLFINLFFAFVNRLQIDSNAQILLRQLIECDRIYKLN